MVQRKIREFLRCSQQSHKHLRLPARARRTPRKCLQIVVNESRANTDTARVSLPLDSARIPLDLYISARRRTCYRIVWCFYKIAFCDAATSHLGLTRFWHRVRRVLTGLYHRIIGCARLPAECSFYPDQAARHPDLLDSRTYPVLSRKDFHLEQQEAVLVIGNSSLRYEDWHIILSFHSSFHPFVSFYHVASPTRTMQIF